MKYYPTYLSSSKNKLIIQDHYAYCVQGARHLKYYNIHACILVKLPAVTIQNSYKKPCFRLLIFISCRFYAKDKCSEKEYWNNLRVGTFCKKESRIGIFIYKTSKKLIHLLARRSRWCLNIKSPQPNISYFMYCHLYVIDRKLPGCFSWSECIIWNLLNMLVVTDSLMFAQSQIVYRFLWWVFRILFITIM